MTLAGNMTQTNVYSNGTRMNVTWYSDFSVISDGFSCSFASGNYTLSSFASVKYIPRENETY